MRRMVVGISGATGITYGVRLLEELCVLGVETHLVTSRAGEMTRAYETSLSAQELRDKADVKYHINDVGAAIASPTILSWAYMKRTTSPSLASYPALTPPA